MSQYIANKNGGKTPISNEGLLNRISFGISYNIYVCIWKFKTRKITRKKGHHANLNYKQEPINLILKNMCHSQIDSDSKEVGN